MQGKLERIAARMDRRGMNAKIGRLRRLRDELVEQGERGGARSKGGRARQLPALSFVEAVDFEVVRFSVAAFRSPVECGRGGGGQGAECPLRRISRRRSEDGISNAGGLPVERRPRTPSRTQFITFNFGIIFNFEKF